MLRKKLRQQLLTVEEAEEVWARFLELPIDFLDSLAVRNRTWALADRYRLPTLYDAPFLACAESLLNAESGGATFWTVDAELLRQMGPERPVYVRSLRESI